MLRFGVFELDLAKGELRKGGSRIKLRPQPFKVIWLIASRRGEVVTREEIQQQIWGNDTFVDFEQAINQCVKQIRNALCENAETPRYIETLPRRGYRFIAQIDTEPVGTVPFTGTVSPTATVASGAETGSASNLAARKPRYASWQVIMGVVAAAAALITFVIVGVPWPNIRGRQPQFIRDRSIAVLPFVDLSPEKDQEYFCDGLAGELRNRLSRIAELRVIGTTSSLQFMGKADDSRSIGKKLNVAAILEGSVSKQGQRLRITVQLIKAADGFQLWADKFDRNASEVLDVQDEIAREVSDELRPKLLGKKTSVSSAQRTNPEVYNAYLLGRYFYGQRNKENLEKSVNYFQQALELDPAYAPAWVGLAKSYYVEADSSYISPGQGYRKAREAANRALQLDPKMGQAYTALGWIQMHYDWNWNEADAYYRRAWTLEPRELAVLGGMGALSLILGRLDEAIATYRQTVQIDPLSAVALRNLGLSLYYAGQYQEASSALNHALEIAPKVDTAHNLLALVYLAQTQPEAALVEANREGDPELHLQGLALAQYALGHKSDSDANLAELKSKYSDDPFYIAEVYGFRREADRAFEWLERAYDQRDSGITEVKGDPLLKSLERDSRYAALLKKMRLPL